MKLIREKKGSSLVELVVTFALIGIFLSTMAYVLMSSTNTYVRVSSRADAQNVSEILLDKISGEITAAQGGVKAEYTLTIMDRSKITGAYDEYLSYETNECIAFCNRTGSPIYIANENGYLLIHYRPVNDGSINLKAVDWSFDAKVYHDFVISNLSFEIMNDPATNLKSNVVKISLTIENTVNGYEYSCERYVECYNFSSTEVKKIEYKGIKKDGFL